MTDEEIIRCLELLGIPPQEFLVMGQGTYAERMKALDDLRTRARRAFKRAAHGLHPDKTGGDDEKTEELYLLNRFMSELSAIFPPPEKVEREKTLRVKLPRRRQRNRLTVKLSVRTRVESY